MLMVKFDAGASAGSRPFPNTMCVVKAQQAKIVGIVQGQRIVQTVRPFRRDRDLLDLKPDPEPAFDNEALSVEQEEGIEARISSQIYIITR